VLGHRNREPVEDLKRRGAAEATSARALAEASDVVILCVTGSPQVESLVEGPDGRVFINRTLQPGDTYNVPLLEGVTLTAQNGSAVELDLDGQAMGTASSGGNAVEALPLDPQGVADHASDGNAG